VCINDFSISKGLNETPLSLALSNGSGMRPLRYLYIELEAKKMFKLSFWIVKRALFENLELAGYLC